MAPQQRPRLGLAALAVSQVVAWGVLYYAIMVAAPAIAADTGWGEEMIFLIVTAALLTSAACALIGRNGAWAEASCEWCATPGAS